MGGGGLGGRGVGWYGGPMVGWSMRCPHTHTLLSLERQAYVTTVWNEVIPSEHCDIPLEKELGYYIQFGGNNIYLRHQVVRVLDRICELHCEEVHHVVATLQSVCRGFR